jgi:hypothetical protein
MDQFMNKSPRRTVIFAFLTIVLTLALVLVRQISSPRTEIERHRRFIADARINYAKPSGIAEIFSSQAVGWLKQRGLSAEGRAALGKEHLEALIQLGYFNRHSYLITNLDRVAFSSALSGQPLKDNLYHLDFTIANATNSSGTLVVVAHKDDFPIIERLLQSFQGSTTNSALK